MLLMGTWKRERTFVHPSSNHLGAPPVSHGPSFSTGSFHSTYTSTDTPLTLSLTFITSQAWPPLIRSTIPDAHTRSTADCFCGSVLRGATYPVRSAFGGWNSSHSRAATHSAKTTTNTNYQCRRRKPLRGPVVFACCSDIVIAEHTPKANGTLGGRMVHIR